VDSCSGCCDDIASSFPDQETANYSDGSGSCSYLQFRMSRVKDLREGMEAAYFERSQGTSW